MSVSCDGLEGAFCEARNRERMVCVFREDMMVVACVLRWLLRD